ncbi:cytochrome c oxidase assembly protein [Fictibacillus enclensis]|uniref:cytochrome c oxidase assembly protein n=1 Tax=Fictibacillus enclensis TaxID=1017270 RepID=UPI0025A21296|nr:cytochrome c oxidase assembly protein [Fictibacillus enclensis]MDM5198129.1 cytochrome c oxidase assembly protein [Fictibacillus enclensis]
MEHEHSSLWNTGDTLILLLAGIIWTGYFMAGIVSNRHRSLQKWPRYRYVLWTAGILCAGATVVGPLPKLAHHDFTLHMAGHLLWGMLAPLLIVLSAPITLMLRTLPVSMGRRLSRLLQLPYFDWVIHPVMAALLNIGGLWLLYTTDLFMLMHKKVWIALLIQFHVFMAGFVFTMSFIYIEPVSRRFSFKYRAIVLVTALAGHGILSKYLYAHPPAGIEKTDAETGSMLMYYGGDVIDALLIIVFCYQWYQAARPRVYENFPSQQKEAKTT